MLYWWQGNNTYIEWFIYVIYSFVILLYICCSKIIYNVLSMYSTYIKINNKLFELKMVDV